MFWQEKIDILKKKFSQADFRDTFTDCVEILKRIEATFIVRDHANYHFTNWADNLKGKARIRTISWQTVYKEIEKLGTGTNYWVVVVQGDFPTAKHFVYDCRIDAIEMLLSFTAGDFYIIDKKYKWLTYFKVDNDKQEVLLFKSGDEQTPFDIKNGYY